MPKKPRCVVKNLLTKLTYLTTPHKNRAIFTYHPIPLILTYYEKHCYVLNTQSASPAGLTLINGQTM